MVAVAVIFSLFRQFFRFRHYRVPSSNRNLEIGSPENNMLISDA